MDPFAVALDALFISPGSAAGLYLPAAGAAIPIRVIERQRIGAEGSVRPRPVAFGKVFDIRVSEVAEPTVGAALLVNGMLRTINFPPELDVEGLTWTVDVPLLEREIEVLAPVSAADPHGDPEDTFAVAMTLLAARLDRSGTESDQPTVGQVGAWQQATFFVAWTEPAAAITPAYRLRDGGRVFDVQTVAEVGARVGLEITGIARAD